MSLRELPFLGNISWDDYRDNILVIKLKNHSLDVSNLFPMKTYVSRKIHMRFIRI